MNAISAIINTMSLEEQHEFLLFQQKKNRRSDTKNQKLFKLIAKGEDQNLDQKLYGKPAKNSYHALCKRLQDALIDFVATKSFATESGAEMDIMKRLLAARIFFEHKQYKIAFKTLAQAEKKAQAIDIYSILTEIYHTKIQYAHLSETIDLGELKKIMQQNLAHFQQEQELNIMYATVKKALKDPTVRVVAPIVQKAFKDSIVNLDTSLTYKTIFQLMQLTTNAASIQSDYYTNLPFMEQLYRIASAKKESLQKHLFYQIQILYIMALTHFRNKNFDVAASFLTKMEQAMLANNKAFYHRFSEKYIALYAMNQNYMGNSEVAITILEKHKEESLDIKLSLLMSLFQQKLYTDAYAIFKELNHSDVWYEKKMGWLWVLKKSIIEILLLIELDKLELVWSRLRRFKNKFNKKLKQIGETRVLNFIKLVTLYYENPSEVTSKAFEDKVEASFEWIGKEREDLFVMSFYAWLKSKMTQRNLYEVTLELVKK